MRHDFYFGIASYNRVDRQPMLTKLHEMGFPATQILLATQTPEDYEKYSERYGKWATVLFRSASNCPQNKNTILEHLRDNCGNTRVLMLSDKTRGIGLWRRSGRTDWVETKDQMESLVRNAFALTEQIGGVMFGCSITSNKFYMNHDTNTNLQMLGCFMGIIDPSLQMFDERLSLKEDFGFILQHVSKGRATVRFNDVFLKQTLHTTGGSHELWFSEGDKVNERCTRYLLARYPKLIKPHATRKNEVRYIGKSMKLDLSITDFI